MLYGRNVSLGKSKFNIQAWHFCVNDLNREQRSHSVWRDIRSSFSVFGRPSNVLFFDLGKRVRLVPASFPDRLGRRASGKYSASGRLADARLRKTPFDVTPRRRLVRPSVRPSVRIARARRTRPVTLQRFVRRDGLERLNRHGPHERIKTRSIVSLTTTSGVGTFRPENLRN